MNNIDSIKMLMDALTLATKAYEEGHPTMSDKEWDEKFFQLQEIEKKNGFAFPSSPTQNINYEVVNELEKITHDHLMLSLDKTKDLDEVISFLNDKSYVAMCKMDGLTLSLKYNKGSLISAETRGNGTIGENVTHNALVIPSIPKTIPYIGELVVDGEIVCTYDNFQEFSNTYRNPRNFAAGSIRLLDSKECEKRKLTFFAWDVIKGFSHLSTVSDKLYWLKDVCNFQLAPLIVNHPDGASTAVNELKNWAERHSLPIDGIVFKFNDIEYGKSLGATSHHFNNAIAYKFYDETYPTQLKNIEWTMGRTGVLTPVAVFDSVDVDGTEVRRASLHNVSIMEEIFHKELPFVGQKLEIYKANMIIPQVYSAEEIDTFPHYWDLPFIGIPDKCPICGQPTLINDNNGVKTLICGNGNCSGKLINRLTHFCGKKGLDIKGLSTATLEKLIEWEWITCLEDIFNLNKFKDTWIKIAGFGEKSVTKILEAIENAKDCTLEAFISALGIPLIGNNVSKELVEHIDDYADFRKKIKDNWDFSSIDNFGEAKMTSILTFDYTEADRIEKYLRIQKKEKNENTQKFSGMTFVITGKLKAFSNRDEIKSFIESHGGKVTGSVSKKTSYLINNDKTSTSSKNKTALEYNIPIITEEDLMKLF